MPMPLVAPWRLHALALAGYVAVGLLFVWPLPLHLATHVTGQPTGDTGVYLWNLWVFQHELLDHHQFPLFTSTILSLDPRIDLSLHNYTIFADLLALPLLRLLGLVATFNVVYIALTVITAYAGFLLARAVVGRDAEAWLAGLAFAWSPALVARGTAHFSLVAAAPLPIFLLLLLAAERTGRRRYMMAAGVTLAWAAYCDPYYAVYCLLLALLHVTARSVSVSRASGESPRASRIAHRTLNAGIAIAAAAAAAIHFTGGGTFRVAGASISATSLYTPVLALTVMVTLRVWLAWRPVVTFHLSAPTLRLVRLAPYAALTGAVALAPVIVAMVVRVAEGRYAAPRIFWRNSTPGVDLLAFVLPNPNHPLTPGNVPAWLSTLDGGFVENVASVPWVLLLVIAGAVVTSRSILSRYWLGLTLVAASLAVGPFLWIAGVNTHVPGPWSLLRYLPVIGSARAPARFTAVLMMALAVLFALALTSLSRARPAWRRITLCAVAVLLIAELWPAPRPLFAANVPRIYDQIAADPSAVRVMELPFGIRDGLSSTGDFSASSQFFQARHGKPLIGGYLSRVSTRRVEQNLRRPVLRALVLLSQEQSVPADLAASAVEHAQQFVRSAHLGYVVVDRTRATPALQAFAIRVLNLEKIGEDETRTLYRPRAGAGPALAQAETASSR